MTLRARLALALVVIAVVLIVPLMVAHNALRHLHVDVKTLRENEFTASLVLGRLRDAIGYVGEREVALGIVKTDTVHRQLRGALAHVRALNDTLARSTQDSAARRIRAHLDRMESAADREFEALRADRELEADSISQQTFVPALRDTERALSLAEHELRISTLRRVDSAEHELNDAEQVSLTALGVAVILATLIALWLTRSISRPVQALEKGLRAVAEGDLDYQLELSSERRDEFGRLAASFLVMSRQLTELDKLKAEFVSVASHELKTPINVILGYLQLMQEGIYGPLSEKQSQVLGTVEAQGRTLARLSSHLLDVTRFEAGGGRIEPRPVHLETFLHDLERAFLVLAIQRRVEFRVVLRPGLPTEVHWDSDRINEVMGNLLANAFKFTSAGGTVELIASPSDRQVRIEVRDTGAGIPPAQLPHIFEKFYQADNQRSASATGSGLGLAIAKEIVEAHRGSIHCDSTVGSGTTFSLMLPTVVGSRRRTGSHRVIQLEAAS